jgi:hypothetical protein
MKCGELERIETVDVYPLESTEGVVGGHDGRGITRSRDYEIDR